jgi:sugar phosphate isomerase/epimerase
MKRPIALQQLAAIDLETPQLVDLAAEVGCDSVSLFTCSPPQLPMSFRTVSRANLAAFRERLAATGVTVGGVDHFPIYEEMDLDDYVEGLAIGAEIGASRITTAVHDTQSARAVDRLGALSDLAGRHGLAVALEFMGLSAGCASLAKGAWFVDQVGRGDLGLCVDPLHLVRTGGTAAELAALAPRYFVSAQICDGRGLHLSTDYAAECMDREAPGMGDYPLQEIFAAMPADVPLDIETPALRLGASGPALTAFLRDAVVRSRRLLATAHPGG